MKGFKIFRNVLPQKMVVAALEFLTYQSRQQTHAAGSLPFDPNHKRKTPDKNIIHFNEDTKKLMTGHFPPEVRLSETVLDIVKSQQIQRIVRKVTNWQELNAHMPPMARFVSPGNLNAKVPMHQDCIYNKHLADFITVWLPLVEIDKDCGGLTMGDDPEEMLETGGHDENKFWFKGIKKDDQTLFDCVPMTPGDLIVFSKTTIHGSMINRSNRVRYSLDLRYFPTEVSSSKHYMRLENGEIHEPQAN